MRFNLRDFVERIVATFLLAFLANVIVTQRGGTVHWLIATGVGGFAAVIVVCTTVVVQVTRLHVVDPLADLTVRSSLTFLQYILGAMIAAGAADLFTFHWPTVLLGAALAAAGSAMKGLAGIANPATVGASVAVPAVTSAPANQPPA